MHFNIHSLSKKPYLNNNQPDIIALSETRLTEDSCHNILLPGYKFLEQHSKTIYSLVGEMGEIGFGPKQGEISPIPPLKVTLLK